MGLEEALADLAVAPKQILGRHQTCGVALAYQSLPEREAQLLRHLVDETKVPASQISAVLNEYGYSLRYQPIVRHRRRAQGTGCMCPA